MTLIAKVKEQEIQGNNLTDVYVLIFTLICGESTVCINGELWLKI